mgnify:CR=1 FL=1
MAQPFTDKSNRKERIVAAVAAHLLEHGMHNSSLRALADSVGISDRMIMYYFETKEDLIAASLLLIASGLIDAMEAQLPATQMSAGQITDALRAMSDSPGAKSGQRLWFEIIGLAMRGDGPYQDTARRILDGWEDWISRRLGSRRAHLAASILAQIEGEIMIRLIRGTD